MFCISRVLLPVVVVLFFGAVHFVQAADFFSTNFRILSPTVAPSDFGASPNFQLHGSLGEIAVGSGQAPSLFTLMGGFLSYPKASQLQLFGIPMNGKVKLSWSVPQTFSGWTIGSYAIGQSSMPGGPYTYVEVASGTSTTINSLTNGSFYYFVLVAKDVFGNSIATSSETLKKPSAPINFSTSSQSVMINEYTPYTISIPITVANPTLNLNSVASSSAATTTALLNEAVSLNVTTSIGDIGMDMPAGVNIKGSSISWDGVINAPRIRSNSSVSPVPDSGKVATVTSAVEVGADDVLLSLDKAVRIAIPGQAGASVGFQRGDVFTKITNVCSADSQDVGDLLSEDSECAVDSGSDLIVWTKHFTTFVTYTESASTDSSDSSDSSVTATPGSHGHGKNTLSASSSAIRALLPPSEVSTSTAFSPELALASLASSPSVEERVGQRTSADNVTGEVLAPFASSSPLTADFLDTYGFAAFCMLILLGATMHAILRFP